MTRRRMALVIVAGAALVAGALAGSSSAASIMGWVWVGNAKFTMGAEYRPDRAPATRFVPIELSSWVRLTTGDRSFPPRIDAITVDLDENVRLVHEGLGVCAPERIEGASTKRARKRCRGALLGTGRVAVTVKLEGRRRFRISGPLLFFNSVDAAGDPAALVHARATGPIKTTFLIPVELSDSPDEGYGERLTVLVPELAGGRGVLTALRVNLRKRPTGKRYLLGRCPDRRTDVRVAFDLAPAPPAHPDGRDFSVLWIAPCRTAEGG